MVVDEEDEEEEEEEEEGRKGKASDSGSDSDVEFYAPHAKKVLSSEADHEDDDDELEFVGSTGCVQALL